MIELVTFDLDNTLWETDNVIRRAETASREWMTRRLPEFGERFDSASLWALRAEVVESQPEIAHDVSQLRLAVLRRAARVCGCSDEQARSHAAGAFEEFLRLRHEISYYEGALETLDLLADRYTLGALTNGNADFARLGLDRYFAFGFTAGDVGASKPDPAMFEAALRHTGVSPSATVHVGDQPVDDIEGARGVGMHTIWVNFGGGADGSAVGASAAVSRLDELPAVIAGLGGKSSVR